MMHSRLPVELIVYSVMCGALFRLLLCLAAKVVFVVVNQIDDKNSFVL